jgi:hypothetical protein
VGALAEAPRGRDTCACVERRLTIHRALGLLVSDADDCVKVAEELLLESALTASTVRVASVLHA